MAEQKSLCMNGIFVFSKSCITIFVKVGKSDEDMVSVGFVSAKIRHQGKNWPVKSMSSMKALYIYVRNNGAIKRSWSRLDGWVVWQRLACPVEYYPSYLLAFVA